VISDNNPTVKPYLPPIWSILLLIMLSLAGIGGCQAPTAAAPLLPVQTEPAPPPPPPTIERQLLFKLLDSADAAIADDRLTFPQGDNALDFYHQILAIQPDQEDALRGLEQLVEIYIKMAQEALDYERYATARSLLARAKLIVPGHLSIEPTEAQIRLIEDAQRTQLKVDQQALNNQDVTLKAQLQSLGSSPVQSQCRFVIYAKSDPQGRWIYQQLASAKPDSRLRAEIKIRTPAKVERLCFPS
jgi:hypothetical protein